MIKFYTNRDLSGRLNINLAKWKRWSREFLPPDPLGGMQSGYARQYNFNDAFKVFLGGHLVAELRFTIPESKQILEDLRKWFLDKGFYQDIEENAEPIQGVEKTVRSYRVEIRRTSSESAGDLAFDYTIRGILSDRPFDTSGFSVREERYVETIMPALKSALEARITFGVRLLYISELYRYFSEILNQAAPD
jgi:hypothetical protein